MIFGDTQRKAPKQKLTSHQERVLGYVVDRLKEKDRITHVGRFAFERIWFQCAAHYHGFQWHDWDTSRNLLAVPKERKSRRRIISNWLLPTVQRAVSLIYGSEPMVKIAPASEERRDKEAARMGQKAWEHFSESQNLRDLHRQAITGAAVTGCWYYKVCWNSKKGPRIQSGGDVQAIGDVQVSLCSPWEYMDDPATILKEDANWAAQVRWVPVQTVRAWFPKLKEFIVGAPEETEGDILHRRLKGVTSMGSYAVTGLTPSQDPANHGVVRFVDFWHRPTTEFPDGLHLRLCGHQDSYVLLTLEAKEMKNPHVGLDNTGNMELPFYQLPWCRAIERKYPIGLVEPLIPIQRELNEILSEIAENRQVHGRPGWLIPVGSGLEGRQIPTGPDRQVVYNPMAAHGQIPQQIIPTPLPDYIPNSLQEYIRHWQTISAQNDAITGNAPASTRTGRAIALLQMQDDTLYGQIRRAAFGVWADVARAVLILMQNFYREGDGRLLKIAGAGNDWEVQEFSGADLAGGTDVRMIQDNGLGNTVEARQETIDKLIERRILIPGNPRHDRIIIETLELSNTAGAVYGGLTIDEREAMRELSLLTQLDHTKVEPIEAQEYQNHDVHIEIKLDFWKGAEREAMDETAMGLLWANIDQHMKLRQEQLELAAEAAAASGAGGEGEPGKPGSQPKEGGGGKNGGSGGGEPKGQGSPPKPPPSDDTLTQARASGGMNS